MVSSRAAAAALLLGTVACSAPAGLPAPSDPCLRCHGGVDGNAAPPRSIRGGTSASDPEVGAHQAHLQPGVLAAAMACDGCHLVPTSLADHPGLGAEPIFSGLAVHDGATPAWDPVETRCAGTYCHGATLGAGGENHAPLWTGGAGEVACGTCHGAPPPAPHPTKADCGTCHAGYTATTVNVATHVNGERDVNAMACNGCHGSAENPAPPAGTRGDESTSSLAVGAHQQHLLGGAVSGPIACGECHVVPSAMDHADGTVEVAFGTLATDGGASPAWDRGLASCSATYCHGQFVGGNLLNEPVWTTVNGTQAPCGSCHLVPPPPPHTVSSGCGMCHPGYTATTVNLATHVNGENDVRTLTCSSCHGSDANPAPPAGLDGETEITARAVGAHQAHLQAGPLAGAFACGECHVVPTAMDHTDGALVLTWGPLAAHGVEASFDGTEATCTNYCHGATLPGGQLAAPTWTATDHAALACDACHGAPPPLPHPQVAACAGCHPETVDGDGAILVDGGKHVNGDVEAAAAGCGACHPVPPDTGAHLVHYGLTDSPPLVAYGDLYVLEDYVPAGGPSYAFGCGNCHPTDESRHGHGEVVLSPDGIAAGKLKARNAADAAYDPGTGTCSGVYCHSAGKTVATIQELQPDGSSLAVSVYKPTPAWTSGTHLACDGCHDNPPRYVSGGPGAADANTHLGLAYDGWEFGHYVGLPGPWHPGGTRHGGGWWGPPQDGSAITCQTCHYDTVDPANTGPSGFYYLDTTGSYLMPGGDPERMPFLCSDCHGPAPLAAAGAGKTLPLRHVNGRADVVFDVRTELPGAIASLPPAPYTPTRPVWYTDATPPSIPAGAALVPDPMPSPAPPPFQNPTFVLWLDGPSYDSATKTCSNVGCHFLARPARMQWGTDPLGSDTCIECHGMY